MVEFSYICKNLAGTEPAKGHDSGAPACTKNKKTGPHCVPDNAEKAAAAKNECPAADFLKILSMRKKQF